MSDWSRGAPLLLFLLLVLPSGADAMTPQSEGARLWATVTLRDGSAVEGFLIWDLNEATRWDVLQTGRRLPPERMTLWAEYAPEDGGPWDRSVELNGVRLTWEEEDRAYPAVQLSGIRFGHVARLAVDGDEAVVELRSGEMLHLVGTTTDLGPSVRSVLVEPHLSPQVTLAWGDIQEVRLGEPPSRAIPRGRRLYGTLQTRSGAEFTGWITWDADEAFASDSLDGDNRSLAFSSIATIERHERGARVTLLDGEVVQLTGTNDVNRANRGIQIADPTLGSVQVEWEEFARLRLHAAEDGGQTGNGRPGSGQDGGAPLRGTLRTESGEVHSGGILWDMEEGATWELLDGTSEGVQLQVEFAEILRIEKVSPESARVTLRDGRVLTLTGKGEGEDVGEANRGILVTPQVGDPVFLDWAGFRSAEFDPIGDADSDLGPGVEGDRR